MDETTLKNANALDTRIKEVEALLNELNLTDPSGRDNTIRHSPITIQAGMGKVINFELTKGVSYTPTIVQELDNNMYTILCDALISYKRKLIQQFENI